MRTPLRIALILVCFGLFFLTVYAQMAPPDLSGEWTMQTTASFPLGAVAAPSGDALPANCSFTGSATVTQDGGSIMGPVTLQLTNGDPECPNDMQANISGGLQGSQIGGTLDGGNQFGMANFTGSVNGDSMTITGQLNFQKTPAGPGPQAAAGGFNVPPGGPFGGVGGNWSAQRLIVMEPSEIPTLSGMGLALLAAVLLLSSLFVMRRAT